MHKPSDALSFIERHTQKRWQLYLFGVFFLIPVIGNFVSRLAKHGWWLNDFDALACGAWHIGQGLSPYGLKPVCEGLRPATFVYAPQIGAFFTPFVDVFGLTGSRLAYLFILLPLMGISLWYALRKAIPDAPWQFRLMSLAAMAGSALACGNIGLVLHGLVILAALNLKRSRLPFIAVVVLGTLIKPVFLTYMIVLLLEDRPMLARLRIFLAGICAGVAGFVTLLVTAGPLGPDWQAALNAVVIEEQPGIGYFSYTSLIGLSTSSPVTLAGLALFLGLIAVSGLVLAEWSGLKGEQRIVLGLGMAQLLNPRLMDYDMLVLAPCMAMVVMLAKPLGARAFAWASWAFAGVLTFGVVINILEIEHIHRAPISVFTYCLITVFIAALTAWPQRERIRGWFRNPLPVLQDILAQRI